MSPVSLRTCGYRWPSFGPKFLPHRCAQPPHLTIRPHVCECGYAWRDGRPVRVVRRSVEVVRE